MLFIQLDNEKTTILPQCLHFRLHADYFLLSWKIPEEISRQSVGLLGTRLHLMLVHSMANLSQDMTEIILTMEIVTVLILSKAPGGTICDPAPLNEAL